MATKSPTRLLLTAWLVRFAVLGLMLIAALAWALIVGGRAVEEANFRSDLRATGTRLDARVAEAGFERPDGTLRHVLVIGPSDSLVGIDLEESDFRVRGVGDAIKVVVRPDPYHRGLPEDVVDRSVAPYLLARLAPPGGIVLVLLIGLVVTHRRGRPTA